MKRIIYSLGMLIGLAFLSATASAATLTIDIPSCTSYSLSGSTVTCVTGGSSKSCAVAGNSVGLTGSELTLTGTCTGFTPASTRWTGCLRNDSPTTCTMVANGTATYTGTDDLNVDYPGSKAVTFSAPSCTIVGSVSGTVGLSLSLTASCNFTPTTYVWTGCDSAASASSCTISRSTPTGSLPISLTASDNLNHSASASTNVSFSAASGAIPTSCVLTTTSGPATLKTIIGAQENNPSNKVITSFDNTRFIAAGLNNGEMGIWQVKVPETGKYVQAAEYATRSTTRIMYASKTPCDMTSATQVSSGANPIVYPKFNQGRSGVSNRSLYWQTGETWYIMIIDYSFGSSGTPSTSSCTGSTDCSVFITPNG